MLDKNRIGNVFSLTSFGESHGPAIGGVIDGMPSGVKIDLEAVQHELDCRRPGQSSVTTSRNESDRVEVLSGLLHGVTLGTPIGFIIRNNDQHSKDYSEIEKVYRPNHADFTYDAKYGIRDHRGGGRASARETASRVVAGAFARQVLAAMGVTLCAYTIRIGDVALNECDDMDMSLIEQNPVRCPNAALAAAMEAHIKAVALEGDTVGGTVRCEITGVPAGWGEPVFGKLSAQLAGAMMSIQAVKGVEFGEGFNASRLRGSENNDAFSYEDGRVVLKTNNCGGILGGISVGSAAPLVFDCAFKPTPSIGKEQTTIDIENKTVSKIKVEGRHDPCVAPRAVPVVEAAAAIAIYDKILAEGI